MFVEQSKTEARKLSHELRTGGGEHLRDRRIVVGASFVAAASMMAIGLYQIGILAHLPEPPLPHLDADKVDASPEAYRRLSVPDAFVGLASYAATAALAAMGGPRRARTHRWLPLALAAKATVDAMQAARLSVDQWTRHRAFCSYCLLAATATFTALPFTLPEAKAALAHR